METKQHIGSQIHDEVTRQMLLEYQKNISILEEAKELLKRMPEIGIFGFGDYWDEVQTFLKKVG